MYIYILSKEIGASDGRLGCALDSSHFRNNGSLGCSCFPFPLSVKQRFSNEYGTRQETRPITTDGFVWIPPDAKNAGATTSHLVPASA